MERKTYYENEDFKVYLEDINDQVFIHVAIYNATKSVVKDIKRVWSEVVVKLYFEGYEQLFAYTMDNRIVKMIGGAKKIGQHQKYEVWEWDLS